jgi:hypothetical protein
MRKRAGNEPRELTFAQAREALRTKLRDIFEEDPNFVPGLHVEVRNHE